MSLDADKRNTCPTSQPPTLRNLSLTKTVLTSASPRRLTLQRDGHRNLRTDRRAVRAAVRSDLFGGDVSPRRAPGARQADARSQRTIRHAAAARRASSLGADLDRIPAAPPPDGPLAYRGVPAVRARRRVPRAARPGKRTLRPVHLHLSSLVRRARH